MSEKVALYIRWLGGGGAEKVFVRYANYLIEKNYDVDLVLGRLRGPNIKLVNPAVNIVNLDASGWIRSVRYLKEYLNNNSPALLFSTLPHCNLQAIWAKIICKPSVKVIVRESNAIQHFVQNHNSFKFRQLRWLIPLFYNFSDHIVTNSKASALELAKFIGILPKKIKVLVNPLPVQRIRKKAELKPEHRWYNKRKYPIVIAVGALSEQKDFMTLLKAVEQLRSYCPVRCLILGEGPQRSKLEKFIAEKGLKDWVNMPGYVDNPYPYIAHADVLVSSSRWEGLPNVILEALALRTPVVGTDCPGGTSEILKGERYGKLVPIGNSLEIARGIKEILNRKIPQKIFIRAISPYRVEKAGERLHRFFNSVLDY